MRLPFLRRRKIARNTNLAEEEEEGQRAQDTYEEDDDNIYYDARFSSRRLAKSMGKSQGPNRVDIRIKRDDAPSPAAAEGGDSGSESAGAEKSSETKPGVGPKPGAGGPEPESGKAAEPAAEPAAAAPAAPAPAASASSSNDSKDHIFDSIMKESDDKKEGKDSKVDPEDAKEARQHWTEMMEKIRKIKARRRKNKAMQQTNQNGGGAGGKGGAGDGVAGGKGGAGGGRVGGKGGGVAGVAGGKDGAGGGRVGGKGGAAGGKGGAGGGGRIYAAKFSGIIICKTGICPKKQLDNKPGGGADGGKGGGVAGGKGGADGGSGGLGGGPGTHKHQSRVDAEGDDYSDEGANPVQFNNLPRSATVGPVIPTNLVPITGGPLNSENTGLPSLLVPFASFGGILLLVLLLVCLYCCCFKKKKKAEGLTPDNSTSTTSVGLKNQMLTVEMPSSKNQDVTVQKVNGENVMVIKECNPNSSEPTVTTISESAPDSKGIVNVTIVKETMVKVPHKEPGEKTVEGSKSNLGPALVRLSQTQLSNSRPSQVKSIRSQSKGSKSRL